jgi:SAM-dependent methyltransferase
MTGSIRDDPGDEIRSLLARVEETHWWFRARRKVLFALIEKAIPGQKSLKVLDAGCSTGACLAWLKPLGWIVGVDINLGSLRLCAGRGSRELACSDVLRLPFKDDNFHLATALDLIEHIEDHQGALQEIRRVLTPGGLVAISTPAFNWLWSSLDDAGHLRRYSAKSLRQLVEASGFCVERLSYANTFLFPLLLIQRLWGKWRRPHPMEYFSPSKLDPLLGWIFGLEARIIPHFSFCFGGSLICLARKTVTSDRKEPEWNSQ